MGMIRYTGFLQCTNGATTKMAGATPPPSPSVGATGAAAMLEVAATTQLQGGAAERALQVEESVAPHEGGQSGVIAASAALAVLPNAAGGPTAAQTQVAVSMDVETELQCTLCHEQLCKPVSIPCGHSFCRVCLLDFLLSREVIDAQCPICRGTVLHVALASGAESAPVFNVNVTLWNLIQILTPNQSRGASAAAEDEDYALKYDQYDAKWRIAALQQSTETRRGSSRRNNRGDPNDFDSGSAGDSGSESEDDGALDRRRARYPELHVDNVTEDGLQISRNVVSDRDDTNVDGYHAMRIGLAIMEFPSAFQLYNEHQECAIAVIKFEEDEDMDGGLPLFLSEEGADDDFIISDHYDEITLQVIDDGGNIVLERCRGARQGTVTFPQLRLDVPGGIYKFRFTDEVFGVFLEIETRLREPHEELDTLFEDDQRIASFIQDQAGERGRGGRGRRRMSDDEEQDANSSESDDSFIVDDDEEDVPGEFSGSEEDEEEAMERTERRRRARLAILEEEGADDGASDASDGSGDGNEGDDDEFAANEWNAAVAEARFGATSDSDGNDDEPITQSSASLRTRVIDDDHSDEGEADAAPATIEPADTTPSVDQSVPRQGKKRARMIIESDEDDNAEESKESEEIALVPAVAAVASDPGDDVAAREGYPSKRLRQVMTLFQDDDEEEEDHDDASVEDDGDDREAEHNTSRARWVGSDPFQLRQPLQAEDDGEDDDDEAQDQDLSDSLFGSAPRRGRQRQSIFDDDVEEEFSGSGTDDDVQDPWNMSEHGEEDDPNDSDF